MPVTPATWEVEGSKSKAGSSKSMRSYLKNKLKQKKKKKKKDWGHWLKCLA
jgi:hypothetical protein